MDIAAMWKDLLTSQDLPQPTVNPGEADDVVALMQKHRINLQKFGANLLTVAFGDRADIASLHGVPMPPTSPSIQSFTSPLHQPIGTPLWFLAAFPDIVIWLQERLSNHESMDDETLAKDLTDLYGLDPALVQTDLEKQILNSDGHIKANHYAHVVDYYIKETGRLPETAVIEGSSEDIYTGQNLMNAIGEESNFTFIARDAAMYYLHLHSSYRGRFPTEVALIACAGALYAIPYLVETQQLRIEQLLALSRDAETSASPFLEFLIQLEALILETDTPEVTPKKVMDTCHSQAETINRTIGEVLASGQADDYIRMAVDIFMTDKKFRRLRKQLSVSKD